MIKLLTMQELFIIIFLMGALIENSLLEYLNFWVRQQVGSTIGSWNVHVRKHGGYEREILLRF